MSKPITITNTFAAQTGPIPLSQLDTNFTQVVNAINDPATYQNYVVDTGAANAYVVTPSPAWTAYTAGMVVQFLATVANTTASTLNISGLGAKNILTMAGGALLAGNIPAGSIVSVQYDGAQFKLLAAEVGANSSIASLGAVTLRGTVSGGGNQINNVVIGTVTPLAGSFTTVLLSGTALNGFAPGSGGTVTQATNKSTNVTLNTPNGQITMNGAALAGNTTVSFSLLNNLISANDHVVLTMNNAAGGVINYNLWGQAAGGGIVIALRNITAGSLSDAIVFNFAIIKGATS